MNVEDTCRHQIAGAKLRKRGRPVHINRVKERMV